jgi:hypothetical protein
MVERRGLLGGVLLIVGSLPLILTYRVHPVGLVGVALAALGLVVAYGAWQVQ